MKERENLKKDFEYIKSWAIISYKINDHVIINQFQSNMYSIKKKQIKNEYKYQMQC